MEYLVLTGRQAQLYMALQNGAEWMTVKDLAAATGKNTLSPHDRLLLERLVSTGHVEEKEEGTNAYGFGRPAKQFRAV